MSKEILLPNNWFGGCVMLLLLALTAIVPFTLTAWLVLKIAPFWVAGPLSLLVATLTFFKVVKFNQ